MVKKVYDVCDNCGNDYQTVSDELTGGPSLCPKCTYSLSVKTMEEGFSETHPSHYANMRIEPLEFIHQNKLRFETGCIIKYVCRYKNKDGLKDLKKARTYLDLLISEAEATK